jgi:hypothetical protein
MTTEAAGVAPLERHVVRPRLQDCPFKGANTLARLFCLSGAASSAFLGQWMGVAWALVALVWCHYAVTLERRIDGA